MRNFLLILITLVLFNCSYQEQGRESFIKPQLIDDSILLKKSGVYFEKQSISYTQPLFVGKFSFQEKTIFINVDSIVLNRDNPENTYFEAYHQIKANTDSISSNGLELIFDTDQELNLNFIYFDSLTYKYFPIYIINNTSSPKAFDGKDFHSFGIQEAIDSSYYKENPPWYPISSKGVPWCGSGNWNLKLNPKEYIITLMPIFKGNTKTLLRSRIQINNSIFVSEPYKGSINLEQFISKDTFLFNLKDKNKIIRYQNSFLGATPKEFSRHFNKP